MKKLLRYFSPFEYALWSGSVLLIVISFLIFDRTGYLSLISSLVGVTSLIFCAKGNPAGHVLMFAFSIFYSIISYYQAYYSEMITYLGMTAPMALLALFSWLRNPYKGNKAEVRINRATRSDIIWMLVLTAIVTAVFFFILRALDTANLPISTLSITTSFAAVFLCFRRVSWYPLLYAANDVVLIVLWILASLSDISYLSVVICFVVFLFNDLYCTVSWIRMHRRQNEE
ncbi:MAG: nicotinamide mononucleotide transporter [Clostridia bacterium]|nr:nicotinamide mononucleotide transporter [Clostridia bacterium]